MSLHERLQHNRKCFHQFAEQIGNLKESIVNVRDTIIAKQCPDQFPNYVELLKIYEKDVQKMQVTKTLKKNWNEDDIIILIWCVMKYCAHHNIQTHKNLTESDWQFISNMVPGKDKESCRFKWLKMCKVNIQDEPWTKEENDILPTIVGQVQEKGKKDWVEVSTRLFYETNQKIYRTPKQCREHFNNYHDPDIKKQITTFNIFDKKKEQIEAIKGSWSQEEDLELLKFAKELGKKWSIIAKKLRGRTENAVKNRFHAIFRKHLEKNEKAGITDSFDDGSQMYESEDVSSEQNQNSGGAGTMDSPLGKDMISEKKLINKLIKNIENNLKINSSDCYSSDCNSVYSDSSRGNSKALKKSKHKMLQFIHKNYESMSSDDDTSRHSPSPHTAQKSIFSKAYADSIKCKQDDDEMEDNTNNLNYQNNLQHQNHHLSTAIQENQFKQNSRNNSGNPKDTNSPYKAQNYQKQSNYSNNQYQQQQGMDDKNKNGMYQQQAMYQNGNNVQQQQQGSHPNQNNAPSNHQIGSQNFDFFNQNIVLGGQINQSKADSIEEFGNHSYQEIPHQNQQQNQIQASLDHIDMRAEEIKLKVLNNNDLHYNESDQYSYAIVNLSKNEIYLTPPSQSQQMQKIWSSVTSYPQKSSNKNTSQQQQQGIDQSHDNSNNNYDNQKTQNKSQLNQYQNPQSNQNMLMQKNQHQIGVSTDQSALNFAATHPQSILPPTTNILSGHSNSPLAIHHQNYNTQNQPQQNPLYQSQAYYGEYGTGQNTSQNYQGIQNTSSSVSGIGTNMMNIQPFTNQTSFPVLNNIAPSINQINNMKIEDTQQFNMFMPRNSLDLQNSTAFLPYTDNNSYNQFPGGNSFIYSGTGQNTLQMNHPNQYSQQQHQVTINTMNKQ